MQRDHDEWRRPWALEPDAAGPARPAIRVGAPPRPAPAPSAVPSPEPSSSPSPEPVAAPTPAGVPAVAAARPNPQPPPSTWTADHSGPGSPRGSVRPPDTTGTVDAPAPTRRRRGGLAVGLVAGLLGAVVGTGGTLAVVAQTDLLDREPSEAATSPVVTAPTIDIEGDFGSVVPAVARAVTPSVVRIDIIGEGVTGAEEELGLGSGVIYRSDGYIITNNHVAEGSTALRVKLASGESLDAEVVGTDPLNDLAVLKVDRTGLPAINLREGDLVVGETAIAIGSPFGLDASVTAGVVSAVGRDIEVPDLNGNRNIIPAVVQTDAAINPGNSGGALVDAHGLLIGINTAILSGSGGSQGVGFAISTKQAVLTAEQLIATGAVHHAFLGVSGTDVTPEVADRFGLDEPTGALLGEVSVGSAAAAAGLRVDDIVVEVEGEPIETMTDLVVAVRTHQPGDTITVVYLRDGERRTTEVTLGERPEDS